ncbi:hypothetical protein EON83_12925 [bacterium]|nr:MAG: hypothetical protein EON83_12925 [bacterium]
MPEVRQDEYLVFPHCQSVGVKLRAGRKFEIKALASPPQRLVVNTEVAGFTDQWTKWSFDSLWLQALQADLHQSGQWVSVAKRRYLRELSADGGQIVEITSDPTIVPAMGCNVELTVVEVGTHSAPWLTVGFEAFGPHARLSQTLEQTVENFFRSQQPPPIPLTQYSSMSYPAWLARFISASDFE